MESNTTHLLHYNPDDEVDNYCISYVAENVSSGKWTLLGRHLGLDDPVLENAKYQHKREGLREIIYRMLKTWIQQNGSKAKVQILVEALCHSGLVDLALQICPDFQISTLSTSTPPVYTQDVCFTNSEISQINNLKTKLQQEYLELKVPGSWCVPTISLENLLVNLTLTDIDRYGRESESKAVGIEEIFSVSFTEDCDVDAKRYIIIAKAGYGKTTLMKKLAYDWAMEKEYLNEFQLVIFVDECPEDIESVVEAKIGDVYPLLEKMEGNILILVDGYQQSIEYCCNVLSNEVFVNNSMIISCRTECVTFCNVGLLRISSYTEQQTKLFLVEHQNVVDESLWEKLKPILSWNMKLVASPRFVMLLGKVLEEDLPISGTCAMDFYRSIFNFLVRRCLIQDGILNANNKHSKNELAKEFDFSIEINIASHVLDLCSCRNKETKSSNMSKEQVVKTRDLNEHVVNEHMLNDHVVKEDEMNEHVVIDHMLHEYVTCLIQFGRICWSHVISGSHVHFSESDLDCCTHKILEIGLLVINDNYDWYEPIHDSFVEFPAAMYLTTNSKSYDFEHDIKQILKQIEPTVPTLLNVIGCLRLCDAFTNTRFDLLSFYKKHLAETVTDFSKMQVSNKEDNEQLCFEFNDWMRPVNVFPDANAFLLARLRLKQIQVLKLVCDTISQFHTIEVDQLTLLFGNEKRLCFPIPNIYCRNLTLVLTSTTEQSQSWNDVRTILNHLKSNTLQPEISLVFRHFSADHCKQLSSVITYTFSTICFQSLILNQEVVIDLQNIITKLQVTLLEFRYIITNGHFRDFLSMLKIAPNVRHCNFAVAAEDYSISDLELPVALSLLETSVRPLKFNPPIAWSGHKCVQELLLMYNTLTFVDFSSWPKLRTLWLDVHDDVDLKETFDHLSKNGIALKHLILAKHCQTAYSSRLLVTTKNELKIDCESTHRPIVDELVVIGDVFECNFVYDVKEYLVKKRISRLFVTEPTAKKYWLENHFPKTEFRIECVYYEPNFICLFKDAWNNLQYLITKI